MSEPIPIHVAAGLVIMPGDKVLISIEGELPADDLEQINGLLVEQFPGSEFVVMALGSPTTIAVVKGGE